MDQAVNAVFNTNKHPKFGDVLDIALKNGAFRIFFSHQFPRIGTNLLHAEADALFLAIHTQNDHFYFITHVNHLRGMTELARPAHLRDVHQAFHAGLKFHKGAVVDKIGDLALTFHAFRIAFRDVLPGIGHKLLQTKRNFIVFPIKGKHLEGQLLPHGDHLARMTNALPAHIGDVQKTVQATKIHKHTVFGNILGLACDQLPFLKG